MATLPKITRARALALERHHSADRYWIRIVRERSTGRRAESRRRAQAQCPSWCHASVMT